MCLVSICYVITYVSKKLLQDPFGNYVVQYVLGLQDPQAKIYLLMAKRAFGGHCDDRERHDGPFARALKAEVQLQRGRTLLAAGQWRGAIWSRTEADSST